MRFGVRLKTPTFAVDSYAIMFHNYFFLKRLAKSLHYHLHGLTLLECFSQNKDELVMGIANAQREVWLRINLSPQICLIQISDEFKRAKKNSVNLFPEVIDQKIIQISVFKQDRSFKMEFENGYLLAFKMHGSRSNLILFQQEQVVSLFRGQLPGDRELTPGHLHCELQLSYERFLACETNLTRFLPPLGKEAKNQLLQQGYGSKDPEQKWKLLQTVLEQLETNPIWVYEEEGLPRLSLLKLDFPVLLETHDAIEAANHLYLHYTRNFYLSSEKQKALRSIETQIDKTKNYLSKTTGKLEIIKSRRGYDEIANIIMANLHQIPSGAKSTILHDFYSDQEITIKLNPELSPQRNAENFYRKAKNQKKEEDKLKENVHNRELQLLELQRNLEEIRAATDHKTLREKFTPDTHKKEEAPKPYHQYEFGGYSILIGKNARANDTLTLKVANKDDYWLHARDVAGSHVVVRKKPGETLPKDVLERAAEVAAWFSKRKTDSLCPVIFTEKKYVRKVKGTPPGMVMVDKEEVIMVEPKGIDP